MAKYEIYTLRDEFYVFFGAGVPYIKRGLQSIIVYEILHTFTMTEWTQMNTLTLAHGMMFKNFVTAQQDLLISAFGLTCDIALKLALNGFSDLWSYSDFEALCQTEYGVGWTDIKATFDEFTKGSIGTKC